MAWTMLETVGNELNRLKKLQNERKKKVIILFALIILQSVSLLLGG